VIKSSNAELYVIPYVSGKKEVRWCIQHCTKELYVIPYASGQKEVITWCEQHCSQEWYLVDGIWAVIFSSEQDALLFKLSGQDE
jgi:hypothetical protein